MYKDYRILAIIPARGGSKGVPGKNTKELCGKPLIEWTIQAGLCSKYIDRVILSSDSDDIISTALAAGCDVPFKRPAHLADDFSSSMDVITHSLEQMEEPYSHFILLQPTSPLRNAAHIDNMIEEFFEKRFSFMVSVKRSSKHPSYIYEITNNHLAPFISNNGHQLRRQDMSPTYEHNGAIYMASTTEFKKKPSFNHDRVGAFEMSVTDSLDIDNEIDFEIATIIINKKTNSQPI